MADLSPSDDGAWVQRDNRPDGDSFRPRVDEFLTVPRHVRNPSLLPGIPSLPTFRGRVADCAFVLLLLVSRSSLVMGALAGAMVAGLIGAAVGSAGGWIIGRWTRWSLGLRRRRLTHGFVVRMLERGNNDRPKLLESLVETLRGHRLNAKQCRIVAAAYGVATRRLQTCDSPSDRDEILKERDRKVFAATYGRRVRQSPVPRATERTTQRENSLANHRSGKCVVWKCISKWNEPQG